MAVPCGLLLPNRRLAAIAQIGLLSDLSLQRRLLERRSCCLAGAHRPLGIEGWRFAFLTVAAVSLVVGLLNIFFVHDPSWSQDSEHHRGGGATISSSSHGNRDSSDAGPEDCGRSSTSRGGGMDWAVLGAVWRDIRGIMRIPTFTIIIIQVCARWLARLTGKLQYTGLVFPLLGCACCSLGRPRNM